MSASTSELGKQLHEARALSDQFAREATSLSEQLTAVEELIVGLEGKSEVSVPLSDSHFLGLRRISDRWRLVIMRDPVIVDSRLSNATIDLKIEAALAMPTLVAMLADTHRKKIEKIRKAQTALAQLVPVLQAARAEGA